MPCFPTFQSTDDNNTASADTPNNQNQHASRDRILQQSISNPTRSTMAVTSTPSQEVRVSRTNEIRILNKPTIAANDEVKQPVTVDSKKVRDFIALLEDNMSDIPVSSWPSFQIDCLNLVQSYRQGEQQVNFLFAWKKRRVNHQK